MGIKTVEGSNDVKQCLSEIKEHLAKNTETVRGEKEAEMIMVISKEAYNLRSSNLNYNGKVEFSMQCDPSSRTQLFQVE